MNNKISLKTIAPRDLWNIFRGCVWFILAAAVLVTGIFYAYALLRHTPMYSSTATMYLIGNKYDGPMSSGDFAAEYTIAMRVMSDCDYLLKSRSVLNAVGEQVGISNGYGALRSAISINNPEETRVLEVTAVASDPEMAKKIVDSVCEIGAEYINKVLAYDSLSVFEEGVATYWPINNISFTTYIKYGIIAAVLVYIVFLAMFLFDNYIHTEEDIERYLGLTVLGDIPDADAPKKKSKYKYKYGKYKSYRYYKRSGYRYQGYQSKQESSVGVNNDNTGINGGQA